MDGKLIKFADVGYVRFSLERRRTCVRPPVVAPYFFIHAVTSEIAETFEAVIASAISSVPRVSVHWQRSVWRTVGELDGCEENLIASSRFRARKGELDPISISMQAF